MIEELAELISGGTCSKPVSDKGWRPHSEHVGQTGIAINPDLYIAVGISGAPTFSWVSSSKKIVVINTDPEHHSSNQQTMELLEMHSKLYLN